jgi:hypothetical protein
MSNVAIARAVSVMAENPGIGRLTATSIRPREHSNHGGTVRSPDSGLPRPLLKFSGGSVDILRDVFS